MNNITLRINGREVIAAPGQTIMEAADHAGIAIPRLCYHPFLEPVGSCRLCAVEIEGYRGLPSACTTPAENGMRIKTATQKVLEFRREMLRLILERHPRNCLGCPKNGACELQKLIEQVGVDFPYQACAGDDAGIKPAGAYFERDYDLCVHCGRCVRICHEVRGSKAIVLREINGRQEVSTHFDRPLEESGCQFCGACMDVCPVGALRERVTPDRDADHQSIEQVCAPLADIMMGLYQREIPTQSKSSQCTLCDAGCNMVFELSETNRITQVRPDPEGPNSGQSCVQGRFMLKDYLQSEDRLTRPLIRTNDALQEKTWDEALDHVAKKFLDYGPGEIAVLSDARATNESLYLLQKFSRSVLKTKAIDCLAPVGHRAVSEVLRQNLGVMAGTNSLEELDQTGCILAIGFNPPASHPIAGAFIRKAVLKGAKLVVANPYEVSIARYADVHLRYYPGTEPELIAGLLRLLLDDNQADAEFSKQYSEKLKTLQQGLEPYDPETVAKITGVSEEMLKEASLVMAGEGALSILYGLGLLESSQAAEAAKALITLSHLTGGLGKPGGGIFPLHGSGNLQGAWDMGMVSHLLPGQVAQPDGVDVLESLKTGNSEIKALYLALENLEGSHLDGIEPFLEQLDFVVFQDVTMPSVKADVVLPVAAVLEEGGTLTNSQRRVRKVDALVDPPGDAKSVQWVLNELAGRMDASDFQFENADAVFAEIRNQIPAYAGIAPERMPIQWPCPDEQHPGTPMLFPDQTPQWVPWQPKTPETHEDLPDADFTFAVIDKEHMKPFFTGPLIARESLVMIHPDAGIEMNTTDAFGMGLIPGDLIHVVTRSGKWEGTLVINDLLPSRLVTISQKNLKQSTADSVLNAPVLNDRVVAARVERPGRQSNNSDGMETRTE